MVGLLTAAKGYFRQECKVLHFDCNPRCPSAESSSTRTTRLWQQTHSFSPPVISVGNIITNWIGESCMISKSQKKKTLPALMSLVAHFYSTPSCGLTLTGNSIGNRFEGHRSVSGADIFLSTPKTSMPESGNHGNN
jgi:hypothetical protein